MAATQPGLGELAADDLRKHGCAVEGVENDGRSDLVVFSSVELPPPGKLTLVEDLFVIVGQAATGTEPRRVTARLFNADDWLAGAEIAKSYGVRVTAATGFRVIARVRSERAFKRTELRSAVIEMVQRWRPRWRVQDPADLEIWVLESRNGHFRASMRLSTAAMRSRGGRAVEFAGALRPTVAAALVRATGTPTGLLIDPFCGSGTVVGEARQAGWTVFGSDADPAAVQTARVNEPGVEIVVANSDDLPVADAAAVAVATNPPFGFQHEPRTLGRPLEEWWRANLAEFARVVQSGGRVVLLHPNDELLAAAVRSTPVLREEGRMSIRTLGQQAAIWTLRRC